MVDTQYLARTPLVTGQTNKELSVNSADDALEFATQRALAVDMSSGNVALTEAQWTRNFLFICTGQTATRTLSVPTAITGHSANTAERFFAVRNADASDIVTVEQDAGGLKVDLLPGEETTLVANGTDVRRVGQQTFDIGSFFPGVPGNSEPLLRFVFTRKVTFPSGLVNSQGLALVAATAQTDVDIRKNNSSVGTMRWAISGTVASFIMASATSFDPGDEIRLIGPGTADATLADLFFTLAATRD